MASVAVRYAGWLRRMGAQAGPLGIAPGAVGEVSNQSPMVELLIDGSWINITSKVMVRDSGGQISSTRGQTSEGQSPVPGVCSFQLNNQNGDFSPANPLSPYYGKIGRNTQIRISVPKGDDKAYRFWGQIPSWPESWDVTGRDVWVDISAAGILRSLNQSSTPFRSTLYRGLMSPAVTTTPVGYWTLEDMSAATSLASALSGGSPMRITGTPTLSSDTGFNCSAALPVMAGASFTGTVPKYTVTGQSQVRFLMYLPTPPPDGTQLIKCGTTGGTIPYWCVTYNTGGALSLKGFDTDGLTVLVSSGPIAFAVDGQRILVSMELTQSGANISWSLGTIYASNGTSTAVPSSFATQTVGRITSVTVTPGQTITDGVFGHVSVQPDVTILGDIAKQVAAFTSETVSGRLGRICAEQGINYTNVGALSTDLMGPQLPGTFMALVQECVEVDQGILFERETAFGLAYKSRASLYSRSPVISLSYSGSQLSQVPIPVPDDQNTKNTWTVSRLNGSSATSVQQDGPLSVLDPPLGVGPSYSDSITLNVKADSDLAQHASWRVHLGTVDEPRYPSMSVNLSRSAMVPSRLKALNVLFGSRLAMTDLPGRLGDDVSQLVIGIQETITFFEHKITFVGQPESPYHVGVIGTTRKNSGTSYLNGDMTPTSSALSIAVPATSAPWTNSPADAPFLVECGGEVMRVDSVDVSIRNANPYLDTDLSNWSGQAAMLDITTDQLYDIAAHSMLITPDGVSASGGAVATRTLAGTVAAGVSYVACLWAYSPGGYTDLRPAIDWSDAGGVFLSSSLGVAFTVPAGQWTFLTQTLVAPASASMATMRARHGGTPPSSAVWYAWGIRLLPLTSAPSSPQVFNLTRSVNGVVKPHQNNDSIDLFNIGYAGL